MHCGRTQDNSLHRIFFLWSSDVKAVGVSRPLHAVCGVEVFDTPGSDQNKQQIEVDIVTYCFLIKYYFGSSGKMFATGPIDNTSALVQIMG